MEYVYAALLLHRLGKEINEQNLINVVKAAGGTIDEVRIKALVAALQGVNIDEVIRSAAVAPAPVAAAHAAPQAQQAAPAPAQAEKEAKEEKPKEEEALAGLSALFG